MERIREEINTAKKIMDKYVAELERILKELEGRK